jgi:hypothetical protein
VAILGERGRENLPQTLLQNEQEELCQTDTADVVDVYENIVTWSMGCVRVGEEAKGGQLIANHGQECMGIRPTSKKAGSPSK